MIQDPTQGVANLGFLVSDIEIVLVCDIEILLASLRVLLVKDVGVFIH